VRRKPARCDRPADTVAATLAERSGRGLDAGGMAVFRMTRGHAVELAEILDVVETDGGRVSDATVFDAAHPGEVQ